MYSLGHIQTLRSLNFTGCTFDDGALTIFIKTIVKACHPNPPGVSHLNLTKCSHLTDCGISAISSLPLLQMLDLTDLNVTDDGIAPLIRQGTFDKHMTHLSLSRTKISDVVIRVIVNMDHTSDRDSHKLKKSRKESPLSSLQHLKLCSLALSEASLAFLWLLPSLCVVDLYGTWHSEECVDRMRELCRQNRGKKVTLRYLGGKISISNGEGVSDTEKGYQWGFDCKPQPKWSTQRLTGLLVHAASSRTPSKIRTSAHFSSATERNGSAKTHQRFGGRKFGQHYTPSPSSGNPQALPTSPSPAREGFGNSNTRYQTPSAARLKARLFPLSTAQKKLNERECETVGNENVTVKMWELDEDKDDEDDIPLLTLVKRGEALKEKKKYVRSSSDEEEEEEEEERESYINVYRRDTGDDDMGKEEDDEDDMLLMTAVMGKTYSKKREEDSGKPQLGEKKDTRRSKNPQHNQRVANIDKKDRQDKNGRCNEQKDKEKQMTAEEEASHGMGEMSSKKEEEEKSRDRNDMAKGLSLSGNEISSPQTPLMSLLDEEDSEAVAVTISKMTTSSSSSSSAAAAASLSTSVKSTNRKALIKLSSTSDYHKEDQEEAEEEADDKTNQTAATKEEEKKKKSIRKSSFMEMLSVQERCIENSRKRKRDVANYKEIREMCAILDNFGKRKRKKKADDTLKEDKEKGEEEEE